MWKKFWSPAQKDQKNESDATFFSVRVFEKSVKLEMFQSVWKICFKKVKWFT